MTPMVVTLIALGVSVLINLLTAVYIYGKLTQKVTGLESAVSELKESRTSQWERINEQGEKIAGLQALANGKVNGKAASH